MTLQHIITQLGLLPHPEGGFYKETFRSATEVQLPDGRKRSLSTAIYFLIPEGVTTSWHKVASDETWHWYAGDAVVLELINLQGEEHTLRLGNAVLDGEQPQFTIPGGWWQRATSKGTYSLCGCTVSPGFDFDDFEMSSSPI